MLVHACHLLSRGHNDVVFLGVHADVADHGVLLLRVGKMYKE